MLDRRSAFETVAYLRLRCTVSRITAHAERQTYRGRAAQSDVRSVGPIECRSSCERATPPLAAPEAPITPPPQTRNQASTTKERHSRGARGRYLKEERADAVAEAPLAVFADEDEVRDAEHDLDQLLPRLLLELLAQLQRDLSAAR